MKQLNKLAFPLTNIVLKIKIRLTHNSFDITFWNEGLSFNWVLTKIQN